MLLDPLLDLGLAAQKGTALARYAKEYDSECYSMCKQPLG